MSTPLIILAATPLAALLQRSLHRCLPLTFMINVVGLCASALFFASTIGQPANEFSPLLVIDSYGCFYATLITTAAAAISLISYTYIKGQNHPDEYFVLTSLATLGAVIVLFANHFAAFFLGLEILSVSLYSLIAYKGIDGAIQYLILSGVGSSFFLFGTGLLYVETKSLTLVPIASSPVLLAAVAMMVVGIGFKLAVVPLYLWTPDVYQKAPAPVAAFIATISKVSVFVFFMRFFLATGQPSVSVVLGIAIASMLVGNLALFQDNIKRLLAYSSIAHVGYLLTALVVAGPFALQAIALYLTAYCITTIGAFCVITMLFNHGEECDRLSSFRGLAWRHPALASALTLMLFSFAGLPLTAGFIGKVFIFQAAISLNLWIPVVVLIVSSTIGLFYYLRVIAVLFSREEEPWPKIFSASSAIALSVLTFLLLWLGIYPNGLIEFLSSPLTLARG